ncbi:MAG: transglutaminase-like domain-containing protein [Candidatus Dojkabacteria bacterium]|nr:transglutaminase-like domain-containing protein [Candidatus Dojkabacteria bacterium]
MLVEKYLQFGKYTKKAPEWLLSKISKIDKSVIDEEYVKKVLRIIAEEFDPDRYNIVRVNNIRESRLVDVDEILKRRISSCGARATVVASVFRSLCIPTKLIHGRYIETNPEMRHAWNEILLDDGTWKAFDIFGEKREIGKYHKKEFEVVDWEEVEDNIDTI